MASGSSGRPNNAGFNFGSDGILCSYEDYAANQDPSNGTHSDPVIAPNSAKVLFIFSP